MPRNPESNIQTEILIEFGKGSRRLFRQNVGQAWAGRMVKRFPDGSVLLANARPLRAGLCVGSSDIIGWESITIEPADVGRRIAVFEAIEVKTDSGSLTKEQTAFLRVVDDSGGVAIEARSIEDVSIALAHWRNRIR